MIFFKLSSSTHTQMNNNKKKKSKIKNTIALNIICVTKTHNLFLLGYLDGVTDYCIREK